MESVKSIVAYQVEYINSLLTSYIESQSDMLRKTSDLIKNTQQLKANISNIQTALKGIEYFAQFGSEDLKNSAKKLMEDTI